MKSKMQRKTQKHKEKKEARRRASQLSSITSSLRMVESTTIGCSRPRTLSSDMGWNPRPASTTVGEASMERDLDRADESSLSTTVSRGGMLGCLLVATAIVLIAAGSALGGGSRSS